MTDPVLAYLDRITGPRLRSGDMRNWTTDPTLWEENWTNLPRASACVYDFPATSSLILYLLRQSNLTTKGNRDRGQLSDAFARHFLPVDARILHQLVFHEQIYLNVTNSIRNTVQWEVLEQMGLAAEYPRPLSKEFLHSFTELKPLVLRYISKLLDHGPPWTFQGALRDDVNKTYVGSREEYLSFVFDEYAKFRCGEMSYWLSLLDLLTPDFNIRVGDAFEAAMDGLSQMVHDSMYMFTLAPDVARTHDDAPSLKTTRDDTFVLLQLAMGDELGFAPRVESLDDVRRLREDNDIRRLRELYVGFNQAVSASDESIVGEMVKEIRNAKRHLQRFAVMDSRAYTWITTAIGFVPVVGQLAGVATLVLHEVRGAVQRRHNWIYLGHKL